MNRITFLKKHFLAGVFVLVPLGVSVWILSTILRALWKVQELLPASLRPDVFLNDPFLVVLLNGVLVVGMSLLCLIGISILGWSSKQYLGKKALEWIERWIQRIPVIRSVYSALAQLLKTVAAGEGQQFNRVVYVEYPRKGILALAFVTGPAQGRGVPKGYLNVFVPTTPNPTSGFHLLVREEDVTESHLKVEDAFKTILSLGIAQ